MNARLPVRGIDAAEQQEPPECCRDGAAECGIVRNPGEAVLDAIAHVRDRCAWPPPQLEIGHQLTFACNQIKHAIGGRRDANDVALKVECLPACRDEEVIRLVAFGAQVREHRPGGLGLQPDIGCDAVDEYEQWKHQQERFPDGEHGAGIANAGAARVVRSAATKKTMTTAA